MRAVPRFPLRRAAELDTDPQPERWLIESLWADEAVGIVGGEPKCCKSFLALDLAVSVASGTPCLRHFPARQRGPVLLFAAEDPLHVVRRRLEAIALAANVDFEKLDIHVITAPSLRLDIEEDRRRLRATVEAMNPKLLVLDPFVRLHRADENVVADVAPLLGYLRQLQRSFHTAVLLVHHARKGAGSTRAGQALRGSSEMHAWGDSLLYLRRCRGDRLRLSVEHRAAASIDDLSVELKSQGDALALQRVEDESSLQATDPYAPSAIERVEQVLAQASIPPVHPSGAPGLSHAHEQRGPSPRDSHGAGPRAQERGWIPSGRRRISVSRFPTLYRAAGKRKRETPDPRHAIRASTLAW